MAGAAVTLISMPGGALDRLFKGIGDLTAEQKRASNIFMLMEAGADAAVVVGQDGRIALVNAQADRMFGQFPVTIRSVRRSRSLFRQRSDESRLVPVPLLR